ncbi:hypothetical protein [Micromonospora costi]|uniref:hypothetical protein n=1 Tax=Micromonospora costi TaxID=1530042 RepID=UPI0011C47A21|nr:hypothetical protein [Micromonospora costi]
MRGLVSGPAFALSLLLFPLGLAVSLVAEPGYRWWGVPLMLAALGLAVVWWLVTGRHDQAEGEVPPVRHLLLTLAGIFGVQFVLVGLGWVAAVSGAGRSLAVAWVAVGVALFAAFWKGIVSHYGDEG